MDASGGIGKLTIKVVKGELYRDVEIFGKMDPYVTILYLGEKFKTKIMDGAGKEPVWNDSFDINLKSMSDELQFYVKDDDVVGAKEIGSTLMKASQLCINNGVRDWFTFTYEGKEAARIYLETQFIPKGPSSQPGAPVMRPGTMPVMPAVGMVGVIPMGVPQPMMGVAMP
jgi:Ca2+-dependent lipid-binding protein